MPRVPLRKLPLLLGATVAAGIAALVALWATLPSVDDLARSMPRTTALMEQRRAEARAHGARLAVDCRPVRLDQISPALVNAVLISEDAGFYGHGAFDWTEMRNAAAQDLKARRFVRGASTLTQQLAKNLYLGTEKSLLRKAREAVLAVKLERALPKRRILTLYLNVVEWGPGVFGAEAAARTHFGVGAASLSPAQATVLAALLPAPRRCGPSHPCRWLQMRARRLLDRLQEVGKLDPREHAHASVELERLLAGSAPGDAEGDEPPEE